jgi:hypothetical protein
MRDRQWMSRASDWLDLDTLPAFSLAVGSFRPVPGWTGIVRQAYYQCKESRYFVLPFAISFTAETIVLVQH